jgi:hypothetical protein
VLDLPTLRTELVEPIAGFDRIVASSLAFVPSPAAFRKDPKAFATHPVGVGPFTLNDWTHGSQLVLRTAVVRVTARAESGLEGTVAYARRGVGGEATFTFASPKPRTNTYTVPTGAAVTAVTDDEAQNAHVTPPAIANDTFGSGVLGAGNDPTVWVTYQEP